MENKDRTIFAKDLALYANKMCMVNIGGELHNGRIDGVDFKNNLVYCLGNKHFPQNVIPLLKKMEDITVEQSVYISTEIMGYDKSDDETHKKWNENDKRDIDEFGFIQFDTKDSIFMPKIIAYFLKEGFNLHLLPKGTYGYYSKGTVDLTEYVEMQKLI